MRKWYKLDNIGTFYSLTTSNKVSKVFRFSAILKEEVDKSTLQKALDKTIESFPNFNVNLRRGFYWYYLDEATKPNKVTEENLPICFKIYNDSDDFLYRLVYYKKKISLEVSHILSDGKGTIEFFKILLTNYISLKHKIKGNYESPNSAQEKAEDSFSKYYKKNKLPSRSKKKVYRYRGKKLRNQTQFMECHLDLNKVLKLAKKYNTTLTVFLVSVLIHSFKDKLNLTDFNKSIKIDIPVDLRTYFKSTTSMNFFGLTSVSYRFKDANDTLEDIIKSVSNQFKENINAEKLSERANLMVSFEKNWFCRIVPIFIKEPFINLIDKITMKGNTTSLSNVGIIKLDEKVEEYVDSISAITSTIGFQFTICSFKDDLCIGISNNYVNNDIIKNFCRYFSHNNIKTSIDVSEVNE